MAKDFIPVVLDEKPKTRAEQLREQTEEVKDFLREIQHNPVHALARKAKALEIELYEESLKTNLEQDFDRRMALEKLLFEHNKELCSFVAPKLKAVDVTGNINQGVTVVLGLQNTNMCIPPMPPPREMLEDVSDPE